MSEPLSDLPDAVSIYEVSPRDGLQNESAYVTTDGKRRLIEALDAAGLRRIEISSFVSPRWIPQLADADELAKSLTPFPENVAYSALVPNPKGLERARAAGLREVAVFLSASETHNRKNIGKTIDEAIALYREVVAEGLRSGMKVRAYVSTVWGCPYEGEIDPRRALSIARELLSMGCYQVSLGDTIGVGTPRQTREIVRMFLAEIPSKQIALHLHDTRGTALANILVGLEMGIRDYDSSVAGVGGCPYAPGAAGNVASEDLVYMLHGMGIGTGIDLEKLVEAGRVAEALLRRLLPGKVHQAGVRSLKV
jgi:hydroxymethylglutaryl-CoA lyase